MIRNLWMQTLWKNILGNKTNVHKILDMGNIGNLCTKIKEHNGWRIRKKKSVEPE